MGRRCPCGPKHKWCWYECSNIDAWGYYFVDASLPLFSTTSGNNLEKQRIRGKKKQTRSWIGKYKKMTRQSLFSCCQATTKPMPFTDLGCVKKHKPYCITLYFQNGKKKVLTHSLVFSSVKIWFVSFPLFFYSIYFRGDGDGREQTGNKSKSKEQMAKNTLSGMEQIPLEVRRVQGYNNH